MAAKNKVLPHNTEAEKAVLGAMIRSSSILYDVMAQLTENDFYEENENHRAIFAAIERLYRKSVPVDVQTITDELINSKEIEVVGGLEYLVELSDSIITFANIDQYIRIVKEQSNLRAFLKTIESYAAKCYTSDIESVDAFFGQAQKDITNITEKRRVGDFQTAEEVSSNLAKELQNLKPATTDDSVTQGATPTGYSELNKKTHGFKRGELIVVAARPGIGKTTLSLNLAFNAAKHGHTVAYFSLEMPAQQLFKRLVSADSNVKLDSLISGFGLNQNVQLKLQQSCNALSKMSIYIDDTAGIQILDIVAKCRKLKEKTGDLGLVVVDYIGLVHTNTHYDSRQLEVQYVSQTLKKLALDLQVPVIAVAQLNRNVEARSNGEPMLSDLRESGSIEQDADIVLLLHETSLDKSSDSSKGSIFEKQDRAVNEAQQNVAKQEAGNNEAKLVNIIIAKNRSGQQGKVALLFRRPYCKFDALSREGNAQIQSLEAERLTYGNRD